MLGHALEIECTWHSVMIEALRNIEWLLTVLLIGISCLLKTHAETLLEQRFPPDRLNLLVINVVPRHPPYADFCDRNPGHCDMREPYEVALNAVIRQSIQQTNARINEEIKFMSDVEQYGEEEYWSYPHSGRGDCEDKALLKKRRLGEQGIPSGALRLAIAHHNKRLSSHCILTLEALEGTYVLDTLTNELRLWHQTPYNFEMRERVDGNWERFDQGIWTFEP